MELDDDEADDQRVVDTGSSDDKAESGNEKAGNVAGFSGGATQI